MFGLYLLVLCSDMCNEPGSYYVCAKNTYPQVGVVIDLVVLIKCAGVVRIRRHVRAACRSPASPPA